MKVVLLCRVSTQSQDYTRQVVELTDYCNRVGWTIEKVFANKISGEKKAVERPEIVEMIDYIKDKYTTNTLRNLNSIVDYSSSIDF